MTMRYIRLHPSRRSVRRIIPAAAFLLWFLIAAQPLSATGGGVTGKKSMWDIVMDISMTNNDLQSAVLCEAACFSATYSFVTTPFYTLNTPRSVTLAYNGDRAFPRPYIFADMTPSLGTPGISKYRLQVTVNGSPITFLNGETVLNFTGGPDPVRLAGQFNASAYTTGVYTMQVKVTAVHTDNSTTVRTQSTQLMIENEFSSSIARGWSLVGIQRLYFPGAGYMVTEGDGSAVQFVALATPAVDFTVLTLESGSYVRRYPDSTAVFFATSGLMTEIRDRLGRRTTFAYDGSNRLTTITDPMKNIGRSVPYITIGYGANGISSIKTTGHGPDKTTTLTVLADHSLQTISDPDSRSTGFTYDASGRLSTVTDRQGGVQQFTYDSFSWKVTSVKLPQIPVDAGGGGTTNANPTITYSPWQDLGVPRTSTATIPKAPFSPADISGNVTDADGRILGFTPDRYGQPLTMTDRLANVTTITRSGIFPSTVTHPDGSIDTYTFTGARLTRQQLAGDSAITLTYGAAGQLATISG